MIPLLLTVDVFIVKAAASTAPNPWGVVASLASSSVIGLAIGLVMLDLLLARVPPMHAPIPILDRHLRGVTSVQDAPR